MTLREFVQACIRPRCVNPGNFEEVNPNCEVLAVQYHYGWEMEVWEETTGLLWIEYSEYTDQLKLAGVGSQREFYPVSRSEAECDAHPSPVAQMPISMIKGMITSQLCSGGKSHTERGKIYRLIPQEEYDRLLMYVRERNTELHGPLYYSSRRINSCVPDLMLLDKRCYPDKRLHFWHTPCEDRMFLKRSVLPFFANNGQSNFISPYILAEDPDKHFCSPFQRFLYQVPGYNRYHEDGFVFHLKHVLDISRGIPGGDGMLSTPQEQTNFMVLVLEQAARYMAVVRSADPVAVVTFPKKSPAVIMHQGDRFSMVHIFEKNMKKDSGYRWRGCISRKFFLASVDQPDIEWKEVLSPTAYVMCFQGWSQEQVRQAAGEQVLFGGI